MLNKFRIFVIFAVEQLTPKSEDKTSIFSQSVFPCNLYLLNFPTKYVRNHNINFKPLSMHCQSIENKLIKLPLENKKKIPFRPHIWHMFEPGKLSPSADKNIQIGCELTLSMTPRVPSCPSRLHDIIRCVRPSPLPSCKPEKPRCLTNRIKKGCVYGDIYSLGVHRIANRDL